MCGQPLACHGAPKGQMQTLQCAAGAAGSRLGAGGGLGRWWFVVNLVMRVSRDFQRRGCCSPTIVHTALPVCVWPALGVSWATARSNTASAVCRRCGGLLAGAPGWLVRLGLVVCGCGFVGSSPAVEVLLGNHRAQTPWAWKGWSLIVRIDQSNRSDLSLFTFLLLSQIAI